MKKDANPAVKKIVFTGGINDQNQKERGQAL